jgi:hypothetical protein
MRYSKFGSNRICRTAAILAAVGMLWMGSAQLLPAQTTVWQGPPCSLSGLAGAWAYTETGMVIPATGSVAFNAVARYTLDAEGNMNGIATSSSGGAVSNVTLKGASTVKSDCTGTLTVGVYSLAGTLLRTVTFNFVYVDNAQEGRAIVTSLVLANGTAVPAVLTINAKRLR